MTPNQRCYIGIDIGGTNLRGALVGDGGEVLHRFRLASAIVEGQQAFLERLVAGIDDLRSRAATDGLQLAGVGVGVPGLIDSDGLVHSSVNMRPLEGLNLRRTLQRLLDVPVWCANDANLIALGEHRYGGGKGLSSLAVITIGTGLGSGLILNDNLWEGARGFAAEFGHVTVEPDGRRCACGNLGCLEQYVSASALIRDGGGVSPEALAEQAHAGNAVALDLFARMGRHLGIALAGLLNTLNLEGVVIGGGVSASFDLFEPMLMHSLRERCFEQIVEGVVVRRALLGDDAGLFGAALLAHAGVRQR